MKYLRKGIYRHYKGKLYEVLGTARHSETLEEHVVYKALYRTRYGAASLWIRPKTMFNSRVTVNGRAVKRFQYHGTK
ncbi:MAG: DUF1653 domain-containing protein [Candidatus Omnitrophota bacterium]|nr:DUF1653 domain-containing protein [Candidatus Omnitrophota bacterium]MDZ4242601.1 DUF1653 domain-containing protein [Candidatus Omnitrophota bacterium]